MRWLLFPCRFALALVLMSSMWAAPVASAPRPSPSADAEQIKKWDDRHVAQWEKVLTQINRRQLTREKALATATRWMERHQVSDVQARARRVRPILDAAYALDQASFQSRKTALATQLFGIVADGFERPTGKPRP